MIVAVETGFSELSGCLLGEESQGSTYFNVNTFLYFLDNLTEIVQLYLVE
ncbi:hypothetical protein M1O24_01715 [Dehalococcoidia bacterium]|nr:hypothetical protein [Dehalococcoidia bacterium]